MFARYRHTQIGYVILVAVGGALALIASLMAVSGFDWTSFIVLTVLTICLGLFATLTVEIDEYALEIRFGAGVIRKRFPLKDIESCRVVPMRFTHRDYGWGIRLTPHGWLYNVSGFNAVELRVKGGKKCRIGTDDPEGLANAVQRSLGKERGGV